MKGFLLGFSFFGMRCLIDLTSNDVSDKPLWMAYLLFPLLMLIYEITKEKKKR